jgi:hypothetical protein
MFLPLTVAATAESPLAVVLPLLSRLQATNVAATETTRRKIAICLATLCTVNIYSFN